MSALPPKADISWPRKRTSSRSPVCLSQRLDELSDLDHFLRPAAVPVIGIPLAFRDAVALLAEMDALAARIVVPENRVREVSRDEAESANHSVRTVQ
jgi:hypothetical protein